MERSWLQQQAALSKFDGYRDSEPFSKAKVTAAPAPAASSAAPEAGSNGDVVYDPQDASADWSGFAPRNCAGRRMHHTGRPAAHRENIVRSEEHGIVPAADTATEDSLTTRRRIIVDPTKGGGLVLGGPGVPGPEERFTTVARAANAREATPLELKSEGYRYQKNAGRKHLTPLYEQSAAIVGRAAPPTGGWGRHTDQRSGDRPHATRKWCSTAPLGDPLLQSHPNAFGDRGRAAAPSGPGSFLKGLGRQVAESGAVGSVVFSGGCKAENGGEGGGGGGDSETRVTAVPARNEDGPRRKELYAANYNPYTSGYTGHQPRR
ncbi:unnamed protein product [Scytosiphon promiscuus]